MPAAAAMTLDLPPSVDEARARLALAVGLFQGGDLTLGRAAEVAGLEYRAFADTLAARGIPPVPADEDPETIAAEMRTTQALLRDIDARS